MTTSRRRPSTPKRPARAAKSAKSTRSATPATPVAPARDVHEPSGTRLQKLLAAAGVGSRRTCEGLIAAGRVQVDGQVVTELGTRIDPARQVVHVDDPEGVHGDRAVLELDALAQLLAQAPRDWTANLGEIGLGHAVGRMLQPVRQLAVIGDEEQPFGLGVEASDVEQPPRDPVDIVRDRRAAAVVVHRRDDALGLVEREVHPGLVELEDGPVAVDSFRIVDSAPGRALVEVVLHEGRKHVVRRLLDAVGHPVEALVRTDVGPVNLGELRSGRYRALSRDEVGALFSAVGL